MTVTIGEKITFNADCLCGSGGPFATSADLPEDISAWMFMVVESGYIYSIGDELEITGDITIRVSKNGFVV